MATTPVPVKRSGSASGGMPDVWRTLRTEMDRLFDRFTSGFDTSPFPSVRFETSFGVPSPAVDITEDEAAFKLSAEFPGLTEKDIQVSLSGDTLTIKGEKRQEREEKEKNYYLSERSSSSRSPALLGYIVLRPQLRNRRGAWSGVVSKRRSCR